jgi:hypothetical protein
MCCAGVKGSLRDGSLCMSPPLQGSTLHLPIRVRLAALTVDSQPVPPILLGHSGVMGPALRGFAKALRR